MLLCFPAGQFGLLGPVAVDLPPSHYSSSLYPPFREDAATENAFRGSCDEHTCGGDTRREGIEAATDSAARLAPSI